MGNKCDNRLSFWRTDEKTGKQTVVIDIKNSFYYGGPKNTDNKAIKARLQKKLANRK